MQQCGTLSLPGTFKNVIVENVQQGVLIYKQAPLTTVQTKLTGSLTREADLHTRVSVFAFHSTEAKKQTAW